MYTIIPRNSVSTYWVLVLIISVVVAQFGYGRVIYVDGDASGINDGSSWGNAYWYIQDAFVNAQPGDEIRAAQGIYRPDQDTDHSNGSGDRDATFQLKHGLTTMGGYAGFSEPYPDARDIDLYEVVLSGDLGSNDGPGFANFEENSYHVVTGSDTDTTAILDGFTITAGNADGPEYYDGFGGGMYNNNGSPTVINCSFVTNWARYGGGTYNDSDSSPIITNCTFSKNKASRGAGIYSDNDTSPTVTNCIFSENEADNGSGMYNDWYSSPTLINCTFSENIADQYGGGMYNFWDTSPTVTNCYFYGNTAGWEGGGMYSNSDSSPTVTDCSFFKNEAGWDGGGIYNDRSAPTMANCTFTGNKADRDGGGMYNDHDSSPTITNCTFAWNKAERDGGGMYNDSRSSPTVINSIFWYNIRDQIFDYANSNPTVSFSCIQGGYVGTGNIDVNPQFAFSENDLHLMPGSSCIDTGTDALPGTLPQTDADGSPRIAGLGIDMGAYEFNPSTTAIALSQLHFQMTAYGGDSPEALSLQIRNRGVDNLSWIATVNASWLSLSAESGQSSGDINTVVLFVDTHNLLPGDYHSEVVISNTEDSSLKQSIEIDLHVGKKIYVQADGSGKFPTIQAAIDAAYPGDAVICMDGIYRGVGNCDIDFRGKAIAVKSENGLQTCIIDCEGTDDDPHRGFSFTQGETSDSLLNGFTITGGYSDNGGGIYCEYSSPTVTDCSFSENKAERDGGGMYIDSDSSPILTNCTFSENISKYGGGLYNNRDSSPVVTNCAFSKNIADLNGGGMCNTRDSFPSLTDCSFSENKAREGGGMYNDHISPPVTNCTFYRNKATWRGGGMYNGWDSSPALTNCTFSENVAEDGGGMYNFWDTSPTMTNCSFSENEANREGGGMYNSSGSSPTVTYCTFSRNIAEQGGGMYSFWRTSSIINSCTFIDNNSARDGSALFVKRGEFQLIGFNRFIGNDIHDIYAEDSVFSGSGTLVLNSEASIFLEDCKLSCSINGPGLIEIPLKSELIIELDAIVDLSHETDPDLNGHILCHGLLRLRDNASLFGAQVEVSRMDFSGNAIIANCVINSEAGAPYGQFFIEDNVSIWLNKIEADGDRYLDLNPEDFNNLDNIHLGIIEVNITEGVNSEYGGLFELRGAVDFVNIPSYDPDNEFLCQVDVIPQFSPETWTIDQLELVEGAKLNLTNRFDFQYPYDEGGDDEVLYVKDLILGPNTTLNTAFNYLYFENLLMDPTAQIVNVPLLGFSLNNISFDDENDFLSRVKNNNYEDPNYNRIHVERVVDFNPDPKGMMRMCNLKEQDPNSLQYGEVINARAKGLFAKANEDQVLVLFEYLFETSEPGTELVIYLSDIPELQGHSDLSRPDHYIEVARLIPPPPGRPGSVGSGRFGVFKKTIYTGLLDFVRGVRIELELIGPEGACVLIDDWDPQVNCYGICLDLNGDNFVDMADLMVVIREYGLPGDAPDHVCLNGAFGDDGYVDLYDVSGWDWTLNLDSRLNFCENVPLSNEEALLKTESPSQSDSAIRLMDLYSNMTGLLIMGKRGGNANDTHTTKLEDRLYILDDKGLYLDEFKLMSNRGNTKLVMDPGGELYQLSYEEGLIRLIGGESVLPSGERLPYAHEPRYEMAATVSVGLQGDEDDVWGKPVMDAAFDADGYLYVVPVVVHTEGEEAYLAAAKLELQVGQTPPYSLIRLYGDPDANDPADNRELNYLREIEVDNKGNVYVTNSHHLNESDILWIFESSTGVMKERLDLIAPNSNVNMPIPAPIALCASQYDSLLYLASTRNQPDAKSTVVYVLSSGTLKLERTIKIEGMGHITSITENPDTGSLRVAGFTMSDIPDYPNPFEPSFYHPYLAEIPYDIEQQVQALSLSEASDLALPMSILWVSNPIESIGADFNP